jgi:hypothetical protein
MKKYICLAVVLLGMTRQLIAQVTGPVQPDPGTIIRAGEQTKTMDRQQIMANYLQAIASSVTSTDKKVAIKATLFALNPKDSVHKYLSDYYLSHHWQRNTQLQVGSGLDKTSTINGFSAGLSINVLNKRDASEVNLWATLDQQTRNTALVIITAELQRYHDNKQITVNAGILRIAKQHYDRGEEIGFFEDIISFIGTQNLPAGIETDVTFKKFFDPFYADLKDDIRKKKYTVADQASVKDSHFDLFSSFIVTMYFETPLAKAMSAYLYAIDKNGKEPESMSSDLQLYVKAVNAQLTASPLKGEKSLVGVYTYLHNDYKLVSDRIGKAPMLTFSYNYGYVTSGVKFTHVPAFQYLRGLWVNKGIRSWELSVIGADTICTDTGKVNKPVNRHIGALQIGLNKVLFTDKSSASLLEAKIALEGDLIMAGRQTNEDKFKPIGSLTIQGRPSAKSPWFKLITKYDKSGKFFGFLNITLNLDNSASKGS